MAFLSPLFRQTLRLRLLGWLKIPLLGSLRPSVVELDLEHCVVRVPLRRWSKNHLGSMYFGALAMGADCAAGLLAVTLIRARGTHMALVFKSFQAEFLKRPEADVDFRCDQGARIGELVDQVLASGQRLSAPIELSAAVRLADGSSDPVARFVLELSLKPARQGLL